MRENLDHYKLSEFVCFFFWTFWILFFLVWLKDLAIFDCKIEFYVKNPRRNRLETSGNQKFGPKTSNLHFSKILNVWILIFHVWLSDLDIFDCRFGFYASKSPRNRLETSGNRKKLSKSADFSFFFNFENFEFSFVQLISQNWGFPPVWGGPGCNFLQFGAIPVEIRGQETEQRWKQLFW